MSFIVSMASAVVTSALSHPAIPVRLDFELSVKNNASKQVFAGMRAVVSNVFFKTRHGLAYSFYDKQKAEESAALPSTTNYVLELRTDFGFLGATKYHGQTTAPMLFGFPESTADESVELRVHLFGTRVLPVMKDSSLKLAQREEIDLGFAHVDLHTLLMQPTAECTVSYFDYDLVDEGSVTLRLTTVMEKENYRAALVDTGRLVPFPKIPVVSLRGTDFTAIDNRELRRMAEAAYDLMKQVEVSTHALIPSVENSPEALSNIYTFFNAPRVHSLPMMAFTMLVRKMTDVKQNDKSDGPTRVLTNADRTLKTFEHWAGIAKFLYDSHMVQLLSWNPAAHRRRSPQEHDGNMLSTLLTLFVHGLMYAPDERRVKNEFKMTDQWMLLFSYAKLAFAVYDCEDTAIASMMVFAVLRVMAEQWSADSAGKRALQEAMRASYENASPTTVLHKLMAVALEYTPFFCVGELANAARSMERQDKYREENKIPDDAELPNDEETIAKTMVYDAHAFVILVPTAQLKLAAEMGTCVERTHDGVNVKALQLDLASAATAAAGKKPFRPMLVVEGTTPVDAAWTPDAVNDPVAELAFEAIHRAIYEPFSSSPLEKDRAKRVLKLHPTVHSMSQHNMYGKLFTLISPFWETVDPNGRLAQFIVGRCKPGSEKDCEYGARVEDFVLNKPGIVLLQVADISAEQIHTRAIDFHNMLIDFPKTSLPVAPVGVSNADRWWLTKDVRRGAENTVKLYLTVRGCEINPGDGSDRDVVTKRLQQGAIELKRTLWGKKPDFDPSVEVVVRSIPIAETLNVHFVEIHLPGVVGYTEYPNEVANESTNESTNNESSRAPRRERAITALAPRRKRAN